MIAAQDTPVLPDKTRGERQAKSTRTKNLVLLAMATLILVPSMLGFVAKFLEFVHTFQNTADGAFAVTPILNYLLASLGFFCLLIWSAVNGMFHDMEQPKHNMLQVEDSLDRQELPHART